MLNLINTEISQCRCHQSHYCRIGLSLNLHQLLYKARQFITTGPGTDSAGLGLVKLQNRSGPVFSRASRTLRGATLSSQDAVCVSVCTCVEIFFPNNIPTRQFIITGPGTDSANQGLIKLLNWSGPVFMDRSNSIN